MEIPMVDCPSRSLSKSKLDRSRDSVVGRNFSPRRFSVEPIIQAVVMAGGKGTRLHPYSANFPKPLMPLNDMPILELLLRRFKIAGVTDVILAVRHLRHLIEAYFGDGSALGLNIRYTGEEHPLGTAGALGSMIDDLDGDFFVTNGDLLTNIDLKSMVRQHREIGSDATLSVFDRHVSLEFGVIEMDEEGRLNAFHEKPQNDYLISMGLYLLKRDAIRPYLKTNEYLDMPDLLMKLKAAGKDVRCYHEDCVWLDIGRPDDFALAQKMFEENRALFLGPN
jgi:NDP-sugar pyrophosphorylase family protein